ncbi:MAG: hypothetical protein VKJ64_21360 [Leptolyngbyaceae bacterium]|nr:hypothetical protein [Leptolyngbyaceae bacterium]
MEPYTSAGICSLAGLPEPYQTAFRQGNAQDLSGQLLPARTDWCLQIVMLPFLMMYATPLLTGFFSWSTKLFSNLKEMVKTGSTDYPLQVDRSLYDAISRWWKTTH